MGPPLLFFPPTCLDLGQIPPWEWEWERSAALVFIFDAVQEETRSVSAEDLVWTAGVEGKAGWKMDREATGGGSGSGLKCSVFITCGGSLSVQAGRWAGGQADCTVCCSELAVATLVTLQPLWSRRRGGSGLAFVQLLLPSACSRQGLGAQTHNLTSKDFYSESP